jgi:glyoxylase-like metal-dependent hydrolase (beta-lactamase superfamily II)
MEAAYKVTEEIYALPTYFPVPTLGLVPVNAFVLRAREPVLIDTGLIPESDDFMSALRAVIDPADLRWLWLTHPDADHIGSIHRLLGEIPHLRVITTFLSVGIMSLSNPLPMERVYLLNPGQTIDVGDRTLAAVKPPTFDNPSTTGVFDPRSGVFFSSDCFGAVLASPAQEAGDISPAELSQGQLLWGTVDAPWIHKVDRSRFAGELAALRRLAPELILSSHLPPARRLTEQLLGTLALLPDAPPFVGPDQAAMEKMMAELTAVPSA